MTPLAKTVVERLERHQSPIKAKPMREYMKTDQPFYGIQTPLRRRLVKEALRAAPIRGSMDYRAAIEDLWRHSHREAQYAALDIATYRPEMIDDRHWPLYRSLVFSASWWDTLDRIATALVGTCLLQNRTHQTDLDEWSRAEGLWVRRAALLAHLKHKEHTDTRALRRTILTLAPDTQFFIQKAIGWVLREYSKTDPDWVVRILDRYGDRLTPLARREGAKQLNR